MNEQDISNKLDQVLTKLDALGELLVQPTAPPAPPPTNTVLAPYELPALTVDQLEKVDENFIQRDGSVWLWSSGFSPAGTSDARTIVQKYYGYISPKKCPRLWELAYRVLGPQGFTAWNADWEAHKFGVYTSNPADPLPNVSMEDLVATSNFMLFDFRVHRVRDWPQ